MVASSTVAGRREAAPTPGGAPARLWEVDALRTLGILLMVVYHAGYDVNLLVPDGPVDPFSGGWRALQVVTGSTFLGVVGLSYWISDQRARARGLRGGALWRAHARRGREVLAAALLVSVVTLAALGAGDAVRFGVLHLIALLVLAVLPLTVRLGRANALVGAAVIVLGLLVVRETGTDVPGLLVVGFDPGDPGVDWYPLFPWAGCTLVGVAVGAALYPGGERGPWLRRALPPQPRHAVAAGAPGRHSLPIYLVHQPVLIALTAAVLLLTGTAVDWP